MSALIRIAPLVAAILMATTVTASAQETDNSAFYEFLRKTPCGKRSFQIGLIYAMQKTKKNLERLGGELYALQNEYDKIETGRKNTEDALEEKWQKIQDEANAGIGKEKQDWLDTNKRIEELKQGLYCNKCGSSKSAIEKGGENFEKHLKDVSGKRVPASQKLLDAEYRKYNERRVKHTAIRAAGMREQLALEERIDTINEKAEEKKQPLRWKVDAASNDISWWLEAQSKVIDLLDLEGTKCTVNSSEESKQRWRSPDYPTDQDSKFIRDWTGIYLGN